MFPSIATFAEKLRLNGFAFKISYGSGGYDIKLTDLVNEIVYSGFSGDADALLKTLTERAIENRRRKDEKTDPG